MSLPTIGSPIMVTITTANKQENEVGIFIGTYSPEQDKFVLRPLPGKLYIQQLPMFPNQEPGWDFYFVETEKEAPNPHQLQIDIFGIDRMVFPDGYLEYDPEAFTRDMFSDTFTWRLFDYDKKNFEALENSIKAVVRNNPIMLEYLRANDGLTAEVLIDLMNENGLWLSHVNREYKTRDICLAALSQTSEAIEFIPNEIKDREPFFYEIAIERNPVIIDKIPIGILTKEMLSKALTKNPNIIHFKSIKSKVLEILPEYGEPIPPSLKRRLSGTYTDQGDQGTCGRHAFSRVTVKNFFELILPLQADNDKEKECNRFLATSEFIRQPMTLDIGELTPKNCSFSGYIKILLVLHCFFLYQKYVPTPEGCIPGSLNNSQVDDIYDHLYTSVEIPNITHDQRHDLKDALHTLETVQDKYDIYLVTLRLKATLENIKKITDRGLYGMLSVEDSTRGTSVHPSHAVIIVGSFDEYILVKNSWGDEIIYPIKFGYPIYLGNYTYDKYSIFSFVIPVHKEFVDSAHVDYYLQKYDELKTMFNGITVNVINHSCPSKDKQPEECDDTHLFRHQANIFHPSENPRCREEAEEKFQRLKTLCQKKPVKRLRIGAGTRKRIKTRRHKRKLF
jgi:hypothetical protein